MVRELADLAGLRAGELEVVVSFQPEPHSVDGEHVIFAGRDPGPAGDPVLCEDAPIGGSACRSSRSRG